MCSTSVSVLGTEAPGTDNIVSVSSAYVTPNTLISPSLTIQGGGGAKKVTCTR